MVNCAKKLKYGKLCLSPGLGRPPGRGHGNPLQYSCLDNPHGQRSLAGYSPCGCKELDTTKRLSIAHKLCLRHMEAKKKVEAEDQTQRKVYCAADLEAGRRGDKQSGGWCRQRGREMKTAEESQISQPGIEIPLLKAPCV